MYRNLSEYQPEPPHPGEILREDILPCLRMTRAELARHLGVSTRKLSSLINERCSVDRAMAQRLGQAFGHGARYWLGLQVQHDLWHSDYEGPPSVAPLTWSKLPPMVARKPAGRRRSGQASRQADSYSPARTKLPA